MMLSDASQSFVERRHGHGRRLRGHPDVILSAGLSIDRIAYPLSVSLLVLGSLILCVERIHGTPTGTSADRKKLS